VSDNYLRIIPIDPNLMPPDDVSDQSVKLLEPAFPAADKVVAETHGHPVFIDQGAKLEAILCPACGKRLTLQPTAEVDAIHKWWYNLTEPLGESDVSQLQASMPCCEAGVPFSALQGSTGVASHRRGGTLQWHPEAWPRSAEVFSASPA
jgi:hypothetical protein